MAFVVIFGLSILGFAFGQLIGMWQGWAFLMLGSLNLGMGSVGSLLVLVAGEWLSRIDVKKKAVYNPRPLKRRSRSPDFELRYLSKERIKMEFLKA